MLSVELVAFVEGLRLLLRGVVRVIELAAFALVHCEAVCSLVLPARARDLTVPLFEVVTRAELLAVASVVHVLHCVALGRQSVQQASSWVVLTRRVLVVMRCVLAVVMGAHGRVPLAVALVVVTRVVDKVIVREAQSSGLEIALLAVGVDVAAPRSSIMI